MSQLKDFGGENSHTNFIQMRVPQRFDVHANSCVNKEMEVLIEN
jgi:hypothetical protein